ncbi:hypothetical protein B0T14DRAFT_586422 [Immersiella caudata]|uniref:Uncharacterized protein n=1 Tax=Immersiella caudata TaxID=314043 RepID=A0AA39WRG9_9PEZI|nr:hypothetical protein B0T14DRAFT_586422 [Immersiella caudata]
MAPARSLPSLLLSLALSAQFAHGQITLDQIYPDWSYTTSRLTPSTSPGCLAAYRAPISCPETLLGLAASMRTIFKPTPADIDSVCTQSCADSIDEYLLNLITSCTGPGDGATKVVGSGNSGVYADPEPVHVVGWVLQYIYSRSCRKDNSTGEYCYFKGGSANNKFACDDSCNLQFYANAHNYPGAGWFFNHYMLIDQSSWWTEYFGPGWERARECGAVEEQPRYADVGVILESLKVKEEEEKKMGNGTVKADEGGKGSETGSGGVVGGDASNGTAPGTVKTSAAGRMKSPFAWMI